jgi:hypothetical protein
VTAGTPEPSTLPQKIQTQVYLRQLSAAAKAQGDRINAELDALTQAEYAARGLRSTYELPGVATVAQKLSQPSTTVTDDAALAAYVEQYHPGEVEVETVRVVKVRPRFRAELLTIASRVAGENLIDRATGQIIPGVRHDPGGRHVGVSVTPTSDARALFADLAAEGVYAAADLAGPVIGAVLAELRAVDLAQAEPVGAIEPADLVRGEQS